MSLETEFVTQGYSPEEMDDIFDNMDSVLSQQAKRLWELCCGDKRRIKKHAHKLGLTESEARAIANEYWQFVPRPAPPLTAIERAELEASRG